VVKTVPFSQFSTKLVRLGCKNRPFFQENRSRYGRRNGLSADSSSLTKFNDRFLVVLKIATVAGFQSPAVPNKCTRIGKLLVSLGMPHFKQETE
jgi:hypothetical protein